MSSRKRKKRGKQGAAELQGAEAESAEALEAESGDEDAVASAAEGGEAEDAEADVEEEPEAPAVSEISELKPRRKRRRKGADESEQEETPALEAEPAQFAEVGAEVDDEEDEVEAFGDEGAKEAPKTRAQLKRVLESLIFVSDQVITAQQLGRIAKTKIGEVREALAEISVEYEGRGIELVEVNGGYQFRSAAASGPYVRALVSQRPVRLTRAQLETLALIAYRQPITRPEVDDVRGVDSGSAIKVLLERELIKILGRKEDAGRPLLYGTTPFFLEFFGMNTMQELPTLREFTELSEEHQELFKRKTNEIGDLSAEAEMPVSVSSTASDFEAVERWDAEPADDAVQAQPVSLDGTDAEQSVLASEEESESAEAHAESEDFTVEAESDEQGAVEADSDEYDAGEDDDEAGEDDDEAGEDDDGDSEDDDESDRADESDDDTSRE